MPFAIIKVTNSGLTPEIKAELIEEVTDALCRVLGKKRESVVIVVDEYDPDNWGIGGETIAARRKRG